MVKYTVTVTQIVEVELDETKFDEAFMAEFRESFFSFDTVEDHVGHIGQLVARGLVDTGWKRDDFIEGYGPAHEMGISARVLETEIEDVRHD